MNDLARSLFLIAPALALAACAGSSAPVQGAPAGARAIEVSIAAKSGSSLSGTATFVEVDGGVKVTVSVAGAPPGKIATHVHEVGDCSAPDAESAGGHFNPRKEPHALPPKAERHLGDLGNIDVGTDGKGTTEIVVPGANLREGDPSSFLGRAIIVHAKQDDGGQPVGNAGGRIGCGVVKAR